MTKRFNSSSCYCAAGVSVRSLAKGLSVEVHLLLRTGVAAEKVQHCWEKSFAFEYEGGDHRYGSHGPQAS